MKKLLMISACLFLAACTDTAGADRAIRNMGLDPVSVGGYAFFACSKDDTFATKFTAKNKDGQTVRGVVCKGLLFKGSTVRTF
jgi:hypothetical protein